MTASRTGSCKYVYKIATAALWRKTQDRGRFDGAPIDVKDGYIHFSTAAQVEETSRRHFAGRSDLVLLKIDAALLGEDLLYEPSRGGALFPHLYAPLPLDAIVAGNQLPPARGGGHDFSGLLEDAEKR